mgnify:CR=1 FL=1
MDIIKVQKMADEMSILHVGLHKHIVRPFSRNSSKYPEPDYNKTGMAFCGLLKNKTFGMFKKDWINQRIERI